MPVAHLWHRSKLSESQNSGFVEFGMAAAFFIIASRISMRRCFLVWSDSIQIQISPVDRTYGFRLLRCAPRNYLNDSAKRVFDSTQRLLRLGRDMAGVRERIWAALWRFDQ